MVKMRVAISRYTFSKYDPIDKKCIAKRIQFPLKVAFSITIHKSQGMTIPYLEIDCKNANQPGQIGVAVGRASKISGLRVINYKSSLCRRHPDTVYNFYNTYEHPCEINFEDRSCCLIAYREDEESMIAVPIVDKYMNDSDTDIEKSEIFLNFLNELDHNYSEHTEIIDLDTMFNAALRDFIDTPAETSAKSSKSRLFENEFFLKKWLKVQNDKVLEMFNTCTGEQRNFKQNNFTEFYTNFNVYLKSHEFTSSMKPLVQGNDFGKQLLVTIMFIIQKYVLRNASASLQMSDQSVQTNCPVNVEVSAAGRGKIRYIGGYVIAKCRYKLTKTIQRNLFIPGLVQEVKHLKYRVHILDEMIVSAS